MTPSAQTSKRPSKTIGKQPTAWPKAWMPFWPRWWWCSIPPWTGGWCAPEVDLVSSVIPLRHREAGVRLSDLGAVLLSPKSAPAGSKRLSTLLHRPKWASWIVDQFLFRLAEQHLRQLEEQGETARVLHDGSQLEKAESVQVEGLSPLRGSQRSSPLASARHRSSASVQRQATPSSCQASIGLVPSSVAWPACRMVSRCTSGPAGENGPVQPDAKKNGWWGTWLVPLVGASFMSPDRAWAGGPWVTLMQKWGLRFVERWTSRDERLDEQAEERTAWEMARGKKERVPGK